MKIYLSFASGIETEGGKARENLAQYLERNGVEVVPEGKPSDFSDAEMESLMQTSDLTVHFLDSTAGYSGNGEVSLVQRQYEIAERIEIESVRKKQSNGSPRTAKMLVWKSEALCDHEKGGLGPDGLGFEKLLAKRDRGYREFLYAALKQTRPIRVFYSYSKKDREHLDSLRCNIVTSLRSGLITDWFDESIEAGEKWNIEIERELDGCDLFIFLVTSNSLSSDYAYGIELKRAIEKGKNVVPLVVVPKSLAGTDLDNIHAIPTDGSGLKPVLKWELPQEGWDAAADQIRERAEGIASEVRAGSDSVRIDFFHDLGDLKQTLERRLNLRPQQQSRGQQMYKKTLGPMLCLENVNGDGVGCGQEFADFWKMLSRRGRLYAPITPGHQASALNVYNQSEFVFFYNSVLDQEKLSDVQMRVMRAARRRVSNSDWPRRIFVVIRNTRSKSGENGGEKGISFSNVEQAFSGDESITVVKIDDGVTEDDLDFIWKEIESGVATPAIA